MDHTMDETLKDELCDALREICYPQMSHLQDLKRTIENEAYVRYGFFSSVLTPWIQRHFDLTDADVVEIGCGAGSTTSAIAALAKHVYAYDIQQTSVSMTRRRAEIMGQDNITVALGSPPAWWDGLADMVLLCATLEHIDIPDRLEMLRRSWSMLRLGGVLVVADTPNRLSLWDNHTSKLPFFSALPPELAIIYAAESPREEFNRAISQAKNKQKELYWWGRGLSYHEFELALDSPEIIGDGYDPEFGPPDEHETHLRGELLGLGIHQAYSRNDLNMIIQKRMAP